MKKLSDYKGDEAIELWADLLEPLTAIFTDDDFRSAVKSGKSRIDIAKTLLKNHAEEAKEILQRIDPEPVDGVNIILRLMTIITDIGSGDEIKSFFGYAEQVKMGGESSGSVTENTEGAEN